MLLIHLYAVKNHKIFDTENQRVSYWVREEHLLCYSS